MKKFLTLTLLLIFISSSVHARFSLFTAKAEVIALLQDDLFTGTAVGYLDRTGTIDLHSSIDKSIKCVGEFRYTGSMTGNGSVVCNDGENAEFQFIAISALSGYGYGKSSRGGFSFTFGLPLEEALDRLELPKNKTVEETEGGLRLRDRDA